MAYKDYEEDELEYDPDMDIVDYDFKPMTNRLGKNDLDEYTNVSKDVVSGSYGTELEHLRQVDLNDSNIINGFVAMSTYIAMLRVQGHGNKEIRVMMDITQKELGFIINSEMFREIMLAMTANIADTAKTFLASASLKATKTLISLMDSPNEKIKLAASKDILDRIGIKSAEEFVVKAQAISNGGVNGDEAVDALTYGLDEILRSRDRKKLTQEVIIDGNSETDDEGHGDSETQPTERVSVG